MLLVWTTIIIHVIHQHRVLGSIQCEFNSLCTCAANQNDPNFSTLHSVSCLLVPFYKFPNVPQATISQLEVVGSQTTSLEAESLAGCQMQSLILTNNRLQHVADRALGSSWKSLNSLDLSYNQLDSVPFGALRELRSLQWLNLHGNQISSVNGEWSHMKNSLATLFLGENDLSEIPTDSDTSNQVGLRQLKSLIWLNLDGNRIHKIHKHSLPPSLQTASISHNLMENFPLDVITTIPRLQWLYLRGNHIRTLPEHTFSSKLWLEKIDLSENHISTLSASPFNNSIHIRDLNLALNDIKLISDECFKGLESKRIILSYNLVEDIEDYAFKGVIETLEYLDLDHNNLRYVPKAMAQLNSLKYLYLSFNLITDASNYAFTSFGSSLKALSLSGNSLTKIPSDALQNSTILSYVNLAYNKIYDAQQTDFTNWSGNLKSLILNNNRITNIKSHTFTDLKNLKELSLSFNPLRFVETQAFDGLQKLESLEMSSTLDRDDFPIDIFDGLKNLQFLSLDHNNFHEISETALDSLHEIRFVNLEHNKLRNIPGKLFKPEVHFKLRDVRFTSNELSSIASYTFSSLGNLESILLTGNKIKNIHGESFVDLPRLTNLILTDNLITSIGHGAFSNLSSLIHLDLQFNKLSEFSFKYFDNVGSALILNLSHNRISSCDSNAKELNLEVLDLRYNKLTNVPNCLESTSSLRKLYLDFNQVTSLEYANFMYLTSLEHLSLQENFIGNIDRNALFGMHSLQILDMSKNAITQLFSNQFSDNPKLRILYLNANSLTYLAKGVFANTQLEMIDLSSNSFSVVPSLTLADVGNTLRSLSMHSNNLDHIDITTFPNIPYLQQLDISSNKLTILPDNVFTSLSYLQSLNLHSNPLRANFKELFHYAQTLRHLNLANTGVTSAPHFPLPNLVHLNLSRNHIQSIDKNAVQGLGKLKLLDLSYTNLSRVPSQLWPYLPRLKSLDLSHTKIKEIMADSFYGLKNLQVLDLRHLRYLNRLDGKALLQLRILSTLSIQTWPKVVSFRDEICYVLSRMGQLRVLKLYVDESRLQNQLSCELNKKIRHLEITGDKLRYIERSAFESFTRNPNLFLKISGTSVDDLPAGLFSHMDKISFLTIDIRDNLLTSLSPESFYENSSSWDAIGTTLIMGGLSLSGNPFRCGCHLAWLGHWLRRWPRESLRSHNVPIDMAVKINEVAKEAWCTDPKTGTRVRIVDLPPVDMSCQASALSSKADLCFRDRTQVILVTFVVMTVLIMF